MKLLLVLSLRDLWTLGWRYLKKGSHRSKIVTNEGNYKEFYGHPIRAKFFIKLSSDEMAYPDNSSFLSNGKLSITGEEFKAEIHVFTTQHPVKIKFHRGSEGTKE